MNQIKTIELTRDCEVVQIPHGTTQLLAKGTPVDITQTLGGSYTIHAQGALFRVASNDADALGMAVPGPHRTVPEAGGTAGASAGASEETQIWDVLRSCYDPEIPVNIVDLGLVYDLQLSKLPSGQSRVEVRMTLTAPGCGMGGVIAGDAQQKLLLLDGVEEATVEIVWDPPWHQSRITPEGRRVLGLE